MRHFITTAAGALAAALVFGAGRAEAAECHSLNGKRFGEATVVETSEIAHPITLASMSARGVTVSSPFCRVAGVITPTPQSHIRFEVWLPAASAWNGRFQGIGQGGFSGSFFYEPMARALQNGYATSGTDNGHIGSGFTWAVGRPERVDDWGWRAQHLTAVAAKGVIEAYYGSAPRYSYFIGCSKGGTSAMMEAQRFPEDYDGIAVGAPSNEKMFQVAKNLYTHQILSKNPEGRLSPAKLNTLNKAVLAACGGAELGYVEDPLSCRYDPGRLQCNGADAPDCLTAAQVDIARKIYTGPVDANGKAFYVGYPRGSEADWAGTIMGRENFQQAGNNNNNQFYLGALLYGPGNWDVMKLDAYQVMQEATAKYSSSVSAHNPDLTPFKARGGKMIGYVGWNDASVPPESFIKYYEKVQAAMGGRANVESFFRLFMAPGMAHCSGGPGPNSVGGPYDEPAPVRDAQHDIVTALENWVERGVAPEKLIATRYVDNDPAKGIAAQRPWCVYPAKARYVGRGDRSQASSYVCRR